MRVSLSSLAPVICAIAILLLCSSGAVGQTLYGSMLGSVTDASGAAIPEALVTITNKETNQVRTTNTNAEGNFSLPTVQSGTYEVKVTKDGFRPAANEQVAITINSVTRVDLALQIGSVNESVIVSAQAQGLQTDRAEVRAEITTKTLTDIPVPGQRNYQALFITLPGISPPSTPHSIPSNPSRSMSFSTNGANTASNNVRIDGASATNVWLPHLSSYVPALESIETVNVVTNSFDAEQGLAGGAAVNVQIRSGSNDFHGAGFWYHQGNWSQSRGFFLPANQDVPKFVYNQNGGRLGGPVLKDKIFFFGSYEGTYDRRFASKRVTVPDAAMRAGNLSAANTIVYDPSTGNADGTGRTAFPGNIIPQSRIDPLSRRLMELLPLPNVNTGGVLTNNYFAGAPFNFDRKTVDTKFNFNISEKLTAFARLSWLKFDTFNAVTFGEEIGGNGILSASNPGTAFGGTWSATLAATYVLTPTFIVDANFGYTLMDTNAAQPGLGTNVGRDVFGIPGTNGTREFESGFPGFGINGFEAFGSTENFMPYYRHDPQYQYVANANWTKGSHNIRFGFDLYQLRLNHTQPEFSGGGDASAAGRLNFGQGPTQLRTGTTTSQGSNFNAMGTFLLGRVTDGGRLLQVPDEYNTRTSMFSAYIRDQWQVNQKLTVSYGTRYEFFPMPTRSDRGVERYDFQRNQMLVCGTGDIPKDCGTEVGKLYFSPRLGIAYRFSDKTVLRTGFGLNWDPWNLARSLRTNYPVLAVLNINAPALGTATTFQQGLPLVPTPQVGSDGRINMPSNYALNTTDDSYRRGYLLNWNLTIQHQLPFNLIGQVGYVANRSIAINGIVDQNAGQVAGLDRDGQPFFPTFGRTVATNLADATVSSTYHSMQATLGKRLSSGISFNAAYTWSKAIGICCNDDNNGRPRVQARDYFDLNRSLLNFDRTHNVQLSALLELPFGPGKRFSSPSRAVNFVIGGWQLNTLTSIMSGTPFSAIASGGSLRLPGSDQRADQVKTDVKRLGGVGGGEAYYDWTAFARVTEPRFGTAGFNNLRGPGVFASDLSLFRRFNFTERWNLEFRAEAFNWTNTQKFNNPGSGNTNVDNLQTFPDGRFRSGFMEITGTNSLGRDVAERILRLGLRLSF